MLLLDRPNPVGGIAVEGNCLSPDVASFVGRYPIPMRHGLTMGELALLFNRQFEIGCDLEVVPMSGWRRSMFFRETGLPWVAPSPNLPTPASALVYPGQVIWEGTNVSEGRGTTQPFELFGAPFFDLSDISAFIPHADIYRVLFSETPLLSPQPTNGREPCARDFRSICLINALYEPYATSLLLLQAVLACHDRCFRVETTAL